MRTVSDWAGSNVTFGYDRDGNLIGKYAVAAGQSAWTLDANSFDADDRPSGIDVYAPSGVLAAWDYTRNGAGEIASVVDAGAGPDHAYTYDNRYELRSDTTSGSGPSTTAAYAYDNSGNPTVLGAQRQGFDGAGRLCWSSPGGTGGSCGATPAGATTYSYDGRGARTGSAGPGGQVTMGVNQAGQLWSFQAGSGPFVSYSSSPDGLRSSRSVGSSVQNFAWDDTVGVAAMLGDGSDFYVYGPDGVPVLRVGASPTLVLHTDAQDNIRIATTPTATPAATAEYTPWGAVTWTRHNGYTATLPTLGYDSQYSDPTTGYLYLRNRDYDPATAQFLSPDPLFAITGERYTYAGNDPINNSDPLGLYPGEGLVKKTVKVVKDVGEAADDAWDYGYEVVTDNADDAWDFTYRNRGTIATSVAIGTCLIPGIGFAGCAYAAGAAFVLRSSKRIEEHGFRDSLGANLADGALTYLTIGLGGAFESAGAGSSPGLRYVGQLIPAGYDVTGLYEWLQESC